jgi:hypothetical protein
VIRYADPVEPDEFRPFDELIGVHVGTRRPVAGMKVKIDFHWLQLIRIARQSVKARWSNQRDTVWLDFSKRTSRTSLMSSTLW